MKINNNNHRTNKETKDRWIDGYLDKQEETNDKRK